MGVLTIELPPQRAQTEFNLRRWSELLADAELARYEGRVETDRYGHVVMSPPPAPNHGSLQSEIVYLLRTHISHGRVLTECPISTADGVRAADVAWASADSMRELGQSVCFPRAPEICVEVRSPSNTDAEIREKTALYFDAVTVADGHRIGDEGQGARIALSSLDSGRLGIAACATGLAQAALDLAADYATKREQFGRPIAEFEGLRFLLADMAAAVDSARATYLMAARKRDAGRPFSRDAAVAKLIASDVAMKVTTDAVQVLGGYGYTSDYPAERYMREAKVTQIFEGTNQIQRLVISRQLLK